VDEISNPHDRFFREVLGQSDIAADFVANYLPAHVVDQLDLDTLTPQPDSFIDPDLRTRQSDLLLHVELREEGDAWVYVLVEHKSNVDPLVTVQLLRYLVRVWERDERDGIRKPRPVVPIILYHGRMPWNAPIRLGDLFPGPEVLRTYWPDLTAALVDLTAIPEAAIVGQARLRVALLVMQAIFQPDLADRLPGILSLLRDISEEETAIGSLRVILSYIAQTSAPVTTNQMRQAVEVAMSRSGGESMTTLVEQWLEEGRRDGRHEGRHEGLREAICLGLAERFDADDPAVSALSAHIGEVSDLDTLRDVLRGILAGQPLDEVGRLIR